MLFNGRAGRGNDKTKALLMPKHGSVSSGSRQFWGETRNVTRLAVYQAVQLLLAETASAVAARELKIVHGLILF